MKTCQFSKLPVRIASYLLMWKVQHPDEYNDFYQEKDIEELTTDELHHLWSFATTKDGALISK